MRNFKKIITFIFVLLILLVVSGCKKEIIISLNEYQIELTVGQTYEITVNSENIENPEFTFRTLDEGIITLEDNKITAIEAGSNVVKVGLKDNEDVNELTLYVKVNNLLPTDISCTQSLSVMIDEEYQIEYTLVPSNAVDNVSFKSMDTKIVSVTENGKIKGICKGTASIKLTCENSGIEKEITVQVRGTDLPIVSYTEEYEENVKINWGTEFDYLKGITVTDVEDGDITSNIQITQDVDTKEYGTQKIVYSVSDSDGNTLKFERNVEIIWNYDVQFIGHAGSYFGIMNTEEAILYAITQLKYQLVEVDIKQTKDGVFVLCHDDTFGGYTIASTNWEDLKDVEVTQTRKAASAYPVVYGDVKGDGVYTSKLCTLERYLQICKEYNVTAVIELKSSNGITNSSQSRMQALMDEIEKQDMLENVIFLGSQYNCLIWTRNNGYEYIPCQYLVNSCESETYLQRCIDYNLDISINVTGGYSNSEEWLARYKEEGLKISSYTYTQYVDYDIVQEWINKGVDYVTCDWHQMNKLDLPVSSNEPAIKYNVKFVDYDGTVLKEREVEQGRSAAAPSVSTREGYNFIGWDYDLKNIQSDMIFTAQYELTKYSITYMANAGVVTEGKWETKDEFVSDFYNDLFNWIKSKGTEISGLSINGDTYTLTKNSVTITFTSAEDIKKLNVYDFEKTISNILYKPVTRNSDGTCVIVEDNNYFLNSSEYRIKYQGMDQWLYNCIKTSYPAYDTTYTVLSSGKIQIFFRMHQWMNGTTIAAFNNYPTKYIVEENESINPQLPTSPISYTILDEVVLPDASGDKEFLGWYLTADCTGDQVTSIPEGSTGNIILYAKWAE